MRFRGVLAQVPIPGMSQGSWQSGKETERALAQLATPPPIFHYTEAYCAFFSYELATAASAL